VAVLQGQEAGDLWKTDGAIKPPLSPPKGEEIAKINGKKRLIKKMSTDFICCQIRVPSPLERGWGEAVKI
jgi:hypothetical protein